MRTETAIVILQGARDFLIRTDALSLESLDALDIIMQALRDVRS